MEEAGATGHENSMNRPAGCAGVAVREDGDQRLLRSLRALAVPNHLPLLRLLQVQIGRASCRERV